MRHGTVGRRQRNRGHGNGNNGGNRPRGNNRMQVFDSNGPDVRIRGTAHQVVEKYLTLAKDAASMGDRVVSESYLQHAEHYQRIINIWEEEGQGQRSFYQPEQQAAPQPNQRQEIEGGQRNPQAPVRADLGLPASILGGVPKVDATTRTTETTS
jgi:hypothetical protein